MISEKTRMDIENVMDYKKAGVDIEAGYKSVELMKEACKGNHATGGTRRTLADFPVHFPWTAIKNMEDPVLLVSGTDGCGTKVKLGFYYGQA